MGLLGLLLAGPALAQQPQRATPRPQPAPAAAHAEPQETMASFADWTLRCLRRVGQPRQCEILQNVRSGGSTVAQIALGRVAPGEALRLTLVVPPSVSFDGAVRLAGEALPGAELSWRRCIPAGCFADLALDEPTLAALRGARVEVRFTFTDGAGRVVALPFSPNGLGTALVALEREVGR